MTLTIPHLPGRPDHGRTTKETMMASTTIHSLLQEKIQGQAAEITRLNEERAEVRRQVLASVDAMLSHEDVCVIWEDGDNRPARGYATFADLLDAFTEETK